MGLTAASHLTEYGHRSDRSKTYDELYAAVELMRWTGMRISDCQKFKASEIVPNLTHTGFNADFVQKTTQRRCLGPVPAHVVTRMRALPVTSTGNHFTCSLGVLSDRVNTLFERAQAINIG